MTEVKPVLDLKQKIRHATRALIDELGYHNVQMQDIAQKAGIGRATLYRHYPAKELIAAEITHKWAGSFAKHFAPALDGLQCRKERVIAIFSGIIDEGAANLQLLGASLSVLVNTPHLISLGLDSVVQMMDANRRDLAKDDDGFLLDVLSHQLLAELVMIHNGSQAAVAAKQRLARLIECLLDATAGAESPAAGI